MKRMHVSPRVRALSAMAGLLLFAPAMAAQPPEGLIFDLWIRGGTVVDGTGRDRFTADVLIRGDTVAYVGPTAGSKIAARRTLEANGKLVTPGFIDLHSHGEPALQSFNNFLAQGITTVVLGQDGVTAGNEGFETPSLRQWRSAQKAAVSDVTNEAQPVTLNRWMRRVDARGSEVNIAALSGHGSLRLIAGVGTAPESTPAQMKTMKDILRADLAAGAFGMSFGLEYSPGRYASLPEEKALGAVVGKQGGIVMSHMRSEDFDKIGAAVEELLQIDAHVHVSHLKIVAGQRAEEAKAVLAQLERARQGGRQVTADAYPYLASASDLTFLHPEWARSEAQYAEAVKTRRAELEAHLRMRVGERNGPGAILFTSGPYSGMRLSDLAERLGKPFEQVIIDDLGYAGPPQAHFLMAEAVQGEFIGADEVGFCTDGFPEPGHPRSAGAFVKVLEDYVGAPPKMRLERAIYKMTGLAARIMSLPDRGVVTPGAKADLVVMSPASLHSRSTWSDTMVPPSGIDFVIVNGEVALDEGLPVAARFGKLLKRTTPEVHPARRAVTRRAKTH